jgi:glycerol-3-phosphate acyltransferase PlsY
VSEEMLLALWILGAYAIGSIPVGLLVAKSKGIDIRAVGSGNIGATNVSRALGWKLGLVVFVLDVAKGFVPTFLSRSVFVDRQEFWFLVGVGAVLGHCLSPFLGFKGGKGIATSLGLAFGSIPEVAAIAFLSFAVVMALTRFVSLSSIVGVGVAAVLASVWPGYNRWLIGPFVLLFLFVVIRHRANIGRLLRGEEPKFRAGSGADSVAEEGSA